MSSVFGSSDEDDGADDEGDIDRGAASINR